MACHPHHTQPEPLDLPPLERRPLLLQAARLRAQGLKLRQIGERMDCSHGTAANYLKEFERHRFHLLQAVAVDQLLDSILEIVAPLEDQTLELRDRLDTARELRLILASLPKLVDHDEQQRRSALQYWSTVHMRRELFPDEPQQHPLSPDTPTQTDNHTDHAA